MMRATPLPLPRARRRWCRCVSQQVLEDQSPHVVAAISDLLDCGLLQLWSLPQTCEANFLYLLFRLAVRGIFDGVDPHYWKCQCGKGLVYAVKHGNMEMIEWLHGCCPSVLAYNAMVEAAKMGNVQLLEWLSDRHERAVWLTDDGFGRIDCGGRGAQMAA